MAANSSSKKKKSKGKGKGKEKEHHDEQAEGDFDERFIAAVNRPQFQKAKDEKTKVVLDDRFASVLTDPRFSLQAKDKYGRKKKGKQNATAESELSEFYTLEKSEEESDDNDDEDEVEEKVVDDSEEEDDDDKDPASRIAYLTALSRGEVDLSESSDDESDSESSDDDDSAVDSGDEQGKAGILDPSTNEEEVSITEVPSPYMAVMNMDWTHVRAVDLFSMIASFTPPGSVRKVQIFPSDFGLERMEKEKREGPSGLWKHQRLQAKIDEDDEQVESVSEEEDEEQPTKPELKFELDEDAVDSGFDQEKLRAYEASKLKYYFAVVEFASPEHADVAYNEVDGLELEHSSASVDMRSIDPDQLGGVVKGRKLRDEASSVPSNYEPPEFVVNALQQTNVECTWDEGDAERARKLTQYSAGQGWQDLADSGDLRAYLASDHSSDDESDVESEDEGEKGNKMRMLLGLDDDGELEKSGDQEEESEDEGFGGEEGEKQATFIPGKKLLEDKIRNKIQSKGETELTPWEKFQEKRKQKRRERRQAARKGGKTVDEDSDDEEQEEDNFEENDDFFVDEEREAMKEENKSMQKKSKKKKKKDAVVDEKNGDRAPSTKAELSLLVAGEDAEEDAKDYDMRGLIRMDKLKGKKLKGARKRKQDKLAANVSGGDFKINTQDNRFSAVLKGVDDRFGIDRTDPSFKDTPAMRDILSEQTKERKKRKRAKKTPVAPNISADAAGSTSSGAMALSSLVQSLKSKVAKNVK